MAVRGKFLRHFLLLEGLGRDQLVDRRVGVLRQADWAALGKVVVARGKVVVVLGKRAVVAQDKQVVVAQDMAGVVQMEAVVVAQKAELGQG